MRPLKLKIQAFGPFSDCQVVDFENFNRSVVFLIHGPTGAGKTTILDSICFALYGETASPADRQVFSLRSDHAQNSTQTEVTFTFKIGQKTYTVTRIPEQKRAKLRGDGYTKQLSIASLWENDTESEGNSKLIADKWNRVTEAIEKLIGFRADQFRQVIVLPQGQFRRFLASSSQERQEILTALFNTGWYKAIEEQLKRNAKEIADKVSNLHIRKQSFFSDENSPDILKKLDNEINRIETEISVSKQELENLKQQEFNLQKEFALAKMTYDFFYEYENLLFEQNQLDQKVIYITELKNQVKKYRVIQELKGSYESYINICKDKQYIESELKKHSYLQEQNNKKLIQISEQIQVIEIKSEEIEHFQKELESLRILLPYVIEIEIGKQQLVATCNKIEVLEKQLNEKNIEREKIIPALEKINQKIQIGKEKVLSLDFVGSKISNYEQILNIQKRIELVKNKRSESEFELNNLKEKNQFIQSQIEHAKKDLDTLQKLHINTQVALLASNLIENQPCPVCGSREHPCPAVQTDQIPDKAELEKMQIVLEDLVNNQKRLVDSIHEKEILKTSYNSEISQSLELINSFNLDNDKNIINELQILQSEKNEILQIKNSIPSLENQQQRGNIALDKNTKEIEFLKAEINKLQTEQKILSDRIDTFSKEHKVVSDSNSIKNKISILQKSISEYDLTKNEILSVHNEILQQNISLQSSISAYTQEHSRITTKHINIEKEFIDKLNTNEFSTIDDYVRELQLEFDLLQTDAEIKVYEQKYHALVERKKNVENQIKDKSKPDLNSIENQISDIKSVIEKTSITLGNLQSQLEINHQRKLEVESLEQQINALQEKYKTIGLLSEIASGNNPLRVTFERFVLGSLLDDVLITSTQRLQIMSRGRFSLLRAQEKTDLRTSGGLDLMIHDSYTGTQRPVTTLSGGESFLASLSLALGLADVVQTYAGGIYLETIFIDEGFGSLDPEALDFAFQSLYKLSQNGRLVGIISHVPELKERITSRLEIKPSIQGSKILVHV